MVINSNLIIINVDFFCVLVFYTELGHHIWRTLLWLSSSLNPLPSLPSLLQRQANILNGAADLGLLDREQSHTQVHNPIVNQYTLYSTHCILYTVQ